MDSVNGGSAGVTPTTGEIEALSPATGEVELDTKVSSMPLGATTVAGGPVFTTLFNGRLIAINRATGAIVYSLTLPTSANAPIAITTNAILVPLDGARKRPPRPAPTTPSWSPALR
jgi:outer membrane protein assembly factor BamB